MLFAELTGIESAVSEMERAYELGAIDGTERAGALVAAEARSRHRYQNRTEDTERETRHLPAMGSALNGTLRVVVMSTTPYSGFLEANPRYAFLGPAFQRRQVEGARVLDLSIQQAMNAAR